MSFLVDFDMLDLLAILLLVYAAHWFFAADRGTRKKKSLQAQGEYECIKITMTLFFCLTA